MKSQIKAASHMGIFIEKLHMSVEAADAVAHRVGIFADQDRHVVVFVGFMNMAAHIPSAGKPKFLFTLGNLLHPHWAGVHRAEHIGGFQDTHRPRNG